MQRARRLVLAGERNDVSSFCAEIENAGHQGWNPSHWPDWLLIEIDGDFLIRPMQARVALEMIQPSFCENSLVQLNMGTCPPVLLSQPGLMLVRGGQIIRYCASRRCRRRQRSSVIKNHCAQISRQANE